MSIFSKLRNLDIWANERLGGNKGETISSRLGRYIEDDNHKVRGWASRFFCRIGLLPLGIFIDKSWKHCRSSIDKRFKK